MTWARVLDALVSPAVFAAMFVLLSVIVTAITTIRVARDRLDHERQLAIEAAEAASTESARERLFEKRLEVVLDASTFLAGMIEEARSHAFQGDGPVDPPQGSSLLDLLTTRLLVLTGDDIAATFTNARQEASYLRSLVEDPPSEQRKALRDARQAQSRFHEQARELLDARDREPT